jgi:polo-like kinase 1|tara:strand:- start:2070 stop:2507 length:438 start_codon:yes stop_codon:yes gene_type:complete
MRSDTSQHVRENVHNLASHASLPPSLATHRDNRTKEVKCPRVVVETYTCPKTNEQLSRSYVRGRPLGKGGFAVVYSMNDPSTGESFAAKVVAKSTLEKDRARQKILTEIRIHRQVSDRFLVKFKRCFEDTNNVYILMELCRYGRP